MSPRSYRELPRRTTRRIHVGNIAVGGGAPISVQSMTNTSTADPGATSAQVAALAEAGADMGRVSCPDEKSTKALVEIVNEANVPIIADIHFHFQRAIEAADAGASCLRFNPGNIGSDDRVAEVVRAASANGCSIRIGVNAGSLEKSLLEKYGSPCPEALVESALHHANALEAHGFDEYKISVKASDVLLAVTAYRHLALATSAPLHLGITEAGGKRAGTVKSALGIGALLSEGIGDTIRVSLAADPVEEVHAGNEILKALSLRRRGVTIVACPSCSREVFPVIRTVEELEARLAHIRAPLSLSVLGCVVNGPGEARETDVGLTGGGRGTNLIYLSGVADHRIGDDGLVDHIVALVEAKAAEIEGEMVIGDELSRESAVVPH